MKNISLICPECSEERKDEAQEYVKEHGINLNDYVKVKITNDDDESEYIWFMVEKINKEKNTFIGRLNNNPVYKQDIKFGDRKEFSFDDIESVGKFKE